MTEPQEAALLANVHLAEAVRLLHLAPGWEQQDRAVKTVLRRPGLHVLIMALKTGATLQEHKVPGALCLQVLTGRVRFSVAGQTHDLESGGLVALAPEELHAVAAEEDSALLLTIAG